MRFDELFLHGVLPDAMVLQGTFPDDVTFCVDTRVIEPGDIFVALEGECTDGHLFLEDALRRGASGLFISAVKKGVLTELDPLLLRGKLVVALNDVLESFVNLAAAWRSQFQYPVVAITGSVGKTSTKQSLASILIRHGAHVLVSEGNQNTRIGLSLNIFKMREDHQAAIFEVGISKRGEMARIVQMVRPTTALITGIGHCHMEGLGSLADIALEKRDIFKYFTEKSIGVINGDQALLASVGYSHPIIKFGAKTTNQIQARKIRIQGEHIDFVLKIYKEKYNVRLHNAHSGFVFNVLGATVLAHYLGVPHEIIVQAVQEPVTVKSRFERKELRVGTGVMINDCYNANPESMKAALLAFEQIATDAQKIAVLGDMLELGVTSPFWHRQLGRFLRKVPSLKHVILVGQMVEWTKKTMPLGLQVNHVATWQDAVQLLHDKVSSDSVVLVKGSNGMHLGHLVEHFTKEVQQ
jgi:UDP-N-acetylmuramoyl-tripeptide--D-alanyl-D-alanine ligase